MTTAPRALFLSHGGGPLPLLGDPGHQEMVGCLERIASDIPRPRALVVFSAHWEEDVPAITSGAQPALIYDYYGFPEVSYEIRYPCPGDPALAETAHEMLESSGIESRLDPERGFDHGVFIPLKIMYPDADIPCIQVSLNSNLDPLRHLAMGRALRRMGDQDVLIVGSGFSFHNLRAFFKGGTASPLEQNEAFEAWLMETCSREDLSETERARRLCDWARAPGARFCHPREEHLLPLHVCYGVTEAPCRASFDVSIMNKRSSMYLW